MDKTDWLLLKALYKEKSMAKAAESLFLSQPAVSYRMNRMEQEYKQTLFSRTNRGIQLTSAGLRLHSFSNLMLQYDDYIFNQVHREDKELTGLITLGTTTNFLVHHLDKQIKEFHTLYPGIQLQLKTDSSGNIVTKMQSRELMMGIVRGKHHWNGPSVELFDEPLIVIASEPISDELLHTQPILLNSTRSPVIEPIDEWLNEYFGETPPAVSPIQLYGDTAALKSLVRQGFGWAVITSTRLDVHDNLYSRPISRKNGDLYHFKTHLIYSGECKSFDTYKAYIEHISNYFSSLSSLY